MSSAAPATRSIRLRATWIVLGLGIGAVVGWVAVSGRPARALTAERLAEGQRAWRQHGPSDYTLELEMGGTIHDRRVIEVRDGRVVHMTTSGAEVPPAAWQYWTVEGMFDFLAQELSNAARPERTYGVSDPAAVVLRARFDPELGYPVYFLRHVMGQRLSTEWRVVDFRSERGSGAGARTN